MARPRKKIDPIIVQKLAGMHCSIEEIAAFFDCSRDTIERRFAAIIVNGREKGKTVIRDGLWKLAQKGNLGALIWLSKNHLGMSDKLESKNEQIGPIEIKQLSDNDLDKKIHQLSQRLKITAT